jgi:heptosyltransferase-1
MNLSQLAAEIATCAAVVTVDSGLGHLTAALDVPAIALYGPTDPAKIGTYGLHQTHLHASNFPSVNTITEPPIMAPLTPDIVWNALQPVLIGNTELAR